MRRLVLPFTLALAACGAKQPEGQVVGAVNGEEITRRDIVAEWEADGSSADVDAQASTRLLLQKLVDRKLLAAEARRLSVEQSPEYLSAERRMREQLLLDGLASRISQDWAPPTIGEVDAFIRSNPQIFKDRKLLLVDRISVIDPAAATRIRQFSMSDNDAVASELDRLAVTYERRAVVLDTGTMSADEAAQRERTHAVRRWAGTVFTSDVTRTVSANPVRSAQWPAIARAELRRRAQDHALDALLRSLRSKAEIKYQRGFEPGAEAIDRGEPH